VIDAVDKTEYADGVRMMVNDLLAGVSKICPDNSATFTILLSTLEVLPRNACAENLLAK
jgi:hypothetical protein